MAEVITNSHFAIEYVEPPTEDRRWARNMHMEVICRSVERAIELLRERVGPDPVIHVVRRVGRESTLLVDKEL